MKYIDIHAHLTFKDFDADRVEVLSRMSDAQVAAINIAVDAKSSQEVIDLAHASFTSIEEKQLRAIVGLHPVYVSNLKSKKAIQKEIATIAHLAASSQYVVGIGECGLDYFHCKGETEEEKQHEKVLQEYAFRLQIEMAVSLNKPIMIHCRDAYPEVLKILREYKKNYGDTLKVNFHFFAGTEKELEQIIELGFYVSFTGVITFAKEYEDIIKKVPRDRFMIETDCPYVAPIPHRGKRNEPSFVVEMAKKIAEIKREEEDVIAGQILENTKRFFIDFS